MGIHHFLHLLNFKSRGVKFLKYHFGAILLFTLLYWGQDKFYANYPKFAKKIGLGKRHDAHDMKIDWYYWLWFSALTQTTIGYGGVSALGGRDGLGFTAIPNKLYKFINLMQFFSVFIVTAMLI